jgi:hypothetical protein
VLTSLRSYTELAGTTDGQERISGVRVPASYRVPFCRGNGAPLSLKKHHQRLLAELSSIELGQHPADLAVQAGDLVVVEGELEPMVRDS